MKWHPLNTVLLAESSEQLGFSLAHFWPIFAPYPLLDFFHNVIIPSILM